MAAQAQATFRLWLRDDIGLQTDAHATQMMANGFGSFADCNSWIPKILRTSVDN